jgi:hypothetical protein
MAMQSDIGDLRIDEEDVASGERGDLRTTQDKIKERAMTLREDKERHKRHIGKVALYASIGITFVILLYLGYMIFRGTLNPDVATHILVFILGTAAGFGASKAIH